MNKANFSTSISRLFEKFKNGIQYYESDKYNESQLRMDFLDNMWRYLGWNVNNEGLSYDEREVITEQNINNKFVDYQIRLNRLPKFNVEAKKPSESTSKKEHIFQAKSYSFSSAIPMVILTNFKEFKFYIITEKPILELPDANLFWEWNYNEDKIYDLIEFLWKYFSKEAVTTGSLENAYAEIIGRRNISEIDSISLLLNKASGILDESFVKDSNNWRLRIARAILNENPMTSSELALQTQLVLNRLIYIRILEDNSLEGETLLVKTIESKRNGTDFSDDLLSYFKELDKRYNSNLFVTSIDISKFDTRKLIDVVKDLYYPNTVYNFGAIPLDVLGRVFEEFLSHTISISDNNVNLVFNDKFRKKGGVYYTPQLLVDYVTKSAIENLPTLSLLEQNYPSIADITCGSGVFLVEAFRTLIEKLEKQADSYDEEQKSELQARGIIRYSTIVKRFVLTTKEKNKLLKQSIHGVDIDEQAVEITKLNLFIAMITGSDDYVDETITPVLPNMIENIKVGNSIVSSDFVTAEMSVELISSVNPIDISEKYDLILGNPPYIEQAQLKKSYPKEMIAYLKTKYNDQVYGNYDASIIFLYRAYELLKPNGILGYVMNQLFLLREYGKKLRDFFSGNNVINEIVSFEEIQLFKGVTTYIALLRLTKSLNTTFKAKVVKSLQQWKDNPSNNMLNVNSSFLSKSERWKINSQFYYDVMSSISYSLLKSDIPENNIFVGTQTDADDVFLLKFLESINEKIGVYYSPILDKKIRLEKSIMIPATKGSCTIHRYYLAEKISLLMPYDGEKTLSEEELENRYPLAWKYLNLAKIKNILENRDKVKEGTKKWFEFTIPKNMKRQTIPKILVPAMIDGSRFWADNNGEYAFIGSGIGGGGGFAIELPSDSIYTFNSLLGILNSEFYNFYIRENESPYNAKFYGVDKSRILEFPLPIDPSEEQLIELDDSVTELSNIVKKWQKEKYTIKNSRLFSYQYEPLNKKIDNIVYSIFRVPPEIQRNIHEKYPISLPLKIFSGNI